jgi:hypothetical protein
MAGAPPRVKLFPPAVKLSWSKGAPDLEAVTVYGPAGKLSDTVELVWLRAVEVGPAVSVMVSVIVLVVVVAGSWRSKSASAVISSFEVLTIRSMLMAMFGRDSEKEKEQDDQAAQIHGVGAVGQINLFLQWTARSTPADRW